MDWLAILKVTFLFLGVWWTIVNTARFLRKNDIPGFNFFLQSVGIVGFVVMHFNMI